MVEMKQIASTNARLLGHMEVLQYIRQTKRMHPITFHLALTDKCNLSCKFCSVKNREMNELELVEAREIIQEFEILGAKSVEITGGGDPCCYPYLGDVINFATGHCGLAVGLITNGIDLPKVDHTALAKLNWLRISLSAVDFGLEDKLYKIDPLFLPTQTGCSYVYSKEEGTPENFLKAVEIAKYLKAKYLRLIPNCYTTEEVEWGKQNLPKMAAKYPDLVFDQVKEFNVPNQCYWRYMKPFVNSDGYVYQCSTCALFAGKFSKPWRVCHWKDYFKLTLKKATSFNTNKCSLCFYKEQNDLLADCLVDVQTPDFV